MKAFSMPKWRQLFFYTYVGTLLYALFNVGMVFEDSRLFLGPWQELFLMLAVLGCVALFAVPVSILGALIPNADEDAPWVGAICGFAGLFIFEYSEAIWKDDFIVVREEPTFFVFSVLLFSGAFGFILYKPPQPKVRLGLILFLSFALAGKLAGISLPPSQPTAPKHAPNVLLVSVDAMRMDVVSSLQLPAYTRLSKEGVVFSQAYAQIPLSGPSHVSLFSGLGPWKHHVLQEGIGFSDDYQLLPEYFFGLGYDTGGFVSSITVDGELGFHRGFQVYDDDFGFVPGWSRTIWGRWYDRIFQPTSKLQRSGTLSVDRALHWLQERESNKPFFAWVQLFEPHAPYVPPPPADQDYYSGDPYDPAHSSMPNKNKIPKYLHQYLSRVTDLQWPLAQYKGELATVDRQLSRLLNWLDKNDKTKNTLVVFVGSHGENHGEDDLWFHHGERLNDAALQVPLMMRLPDIIPAGRRVDAALELIDVLPTIFAVLAQDPLVAIDGRDFAQAIYGGKGRVFTRSCAQINGQLTYSLRDNKQRYFQLEKVPEGQKTTASFLYQDMKESLSDYTETKPTGQRRELLKALGY